MMNKDLHSWLIAVIVDEVSAKSVDRLRVSTRQLRVVHVVVATET